MFNIPYCLCFKISVKDFCVYVVKWNGHTNAFKLNHSLQRKYKIYINSLEGVSVGYISSVNVQYGERCCKV